MPRTFFDMLAEESEQLRALMALPNDAFTISMANTCTAAISDDESDGVDVPETVPAKASKSKKLVEEPEEEEEEGDDEDEDEYFVDKIVDHGFEPDGSVKYKVKWLGYENEEDMTWEPLENLYACHCRVHQSAE